MSLSSRVYLLLIVVSLLIGGSSAYVGGELTETALREELREGGRYLTSTLVEAYSEAIGNFNLLPVVEGVRRLVETQEEVAYIYFTGFDGHVVAHSFERGFPVDLLAAWAGVPPEKDLITVASGSGDRRFFEQRRPLVPGLPAYVHVGLTLDSAERNAAKVRQRILLTTLLLTVGGIGLGTLFARRITTPLSHLASLFTRFGKGETLEAADIAFRASGKEIQALSQAFRDMLTERAKSEAQMRLAGSVFDNTQEGIFVTDSQGRILSANAAFSDITGYSAEETIDQSTDILKPEGQDAAFYEACWSTAREHGHWQGEIWNRRRNGEEFPAWQTISEIRDEEGKISNYVSVFSDITDKKNAEKRIAHLAYHDALTQLPNRLLLYERLEQALARARRHGNHLALLFLDLDRFKDINDSLGHPVGDELLKAVAARLNECVREEDTIARLGGDEFVILVEQLEHARDAGLVAHNILEALSTPLPVARRQLQIATSIGISLYPGDGDNAATLVQNADAAMYRAKDQGRNNYQFYAPEMTAAAFERLSLENSLRHALEREELQLHYQPQVSLVTGTTACAEALARWHHPELGMVPPDRFIPLAEETGLIVRLGDWVLHSACRQLRDWRQAGIPVDRVSVNVSGIQVQRGDLLSAVKSALQDSGLAPQHLELEITESAIMEDAEQAIETLRRIGKLGVKLAMDDFGTGYSSLSYLKQMSLDKLKIDRSFVRDIPGDDDDESIIRAIISLARSLRLQVVAEGVENGEQQQFLKHHGCTVVQGFLHSKPLPAGAFADFVADYRFEEIG